MTGVQSLFQNLYAKVNQNSDIRQTDKQHHSISRNLTKKCDRQILDKVFPTFCFASIAPPKKYMYVKHYSLQQPNTSHSSKED